MKKLLLSLLIIASLTTGYVLGALPWESNPSWLYSNNPSLIPGSNDYMLKMLNTNQ